MKIAHVTPLLKKPSLDRNSLQNYRPVSNLPFLFKILERVVFSRLSDYFLDNDLFDPFQSGYRTHHSVETLLVNVSNYIPQGMDRGNSTALLLLDLSSAFDTVNHTILLNTLSSLGVKGEAYKWFEFVLMVANQLLASLLWSTTGFCGRAHSFLNLFNWIATSFVTTWHRLSYLCRRYSTYDFLQFRSSRCRTSRSSP